MTWPNPNISVRDLETLMDAYAYLLATDARTSNVTWILGDPGMGSPTQVPFGFVSVQSESVKWYTAQGGLGGLASGAPGLDDWAIPIILTICIAPHDFVPPLVATPPNTSPFFPATLGTQNQGPPLPYMEQPGWRTALQITQNVKKVLRTSVTIGGAATDTQIVESRYVIQEVQNTLFRAQRMVIATQQRRIRGN